MKTEYIIALVVILVVAAYVITSKPETVVPKNETPDMTGQISAMYLGTFDKKSGENYLYSYDEQRGPIEVQTTLVKRGDKMQFSMVSPAGVRDVFFNGSKPTDDIICVSMNDERMCARVENTSAMTSYINMIKGLFLNDEISHVSKEGYAIMIEKGAIRFKNSIVDKSVDERACKEISYTRDYSVLTMQDLAKLNIAGGPTWFEETWCIDGNEVVEKTMKFYMNGNPVTTHFKLLDADYNYNGDIEMPSKKAIREPETEPLLNKIADKDRTIETCYASGDPATCFFNFALQESDSVYCKFADRKLGPCYINFAMNFNDPSYCKNIQDIGYYEDCYIEIAGQQKNPVYCDEIKNESKKQTCRDVSKAS
ncbi:MAG: hypothetical protein ABII22_00100 [Candidatus Micrarchaeota archaeon]